VGRLAVLAALLVCTCALVAAAAVVTDPLCPVCQGPLVDATRVTPHAGPAYAPLPEGLFYQCRRPSCPMWAVDQALGDITRLQHQLGTAPAPFEVWVCSGGRRTTGPRKVAAFQLASDAEAYLAASGYTLAVDGLYWPEQPEARLDAPYLELRETHTL
jgi:hypothetical protein